MLASHFIKTNLQIDQVMPLIATHAGFVKDGGHGHTAGSLYSYAGETYFVPHEITSDFKYVSHSITETKRVIAQGSNFLKDITFEPRPVSEAELETGLAAALKAVIRREYPHAGVDYKLDFV